MGGGGLVIEMRPPCGIVGVVGGNWIVSDGSQRRIPQTAARAQVGLQTLRVCGIRFLAHRRADHRPTRQTVQLRAGFQVGEVGGAICLARRGAQPVQQVLVGPPCRAGAHARDNQER